MSLNNLNKPVHGETRRDFLRKVTISGGSASIGGGPVLASPHALSKNEPDQNGMYMQYKNHPLEKGFLETHQPGALHVIDSLGANYHEKFYPFFVSWPRDHVHSLKGENCYYPRIII